MVEVDLSPVLAGLIEVFDADLEIERRAGQALRAQKGRVAAVDAVTLPDSILGVAGTADAHPICRLIAQTPLPWGMPTTSDDPSYIADSTHKRIVEIIGPAGIFKSDTVRIGLYGIAPGVDYGLRTHPAEEVFVMLAGHADWKQGDAPYRTETVGAHIHHPPMVPHATLTKDSAFLCAYIWAGDIDMAGYRYRDQINI